MARQMAWAMTRLAATLLAIVVVVALADTTPSPDDDNGNQPEILSKDGLIHLMADDIKLHAGDTSCQASTLCGLETLLNSLSDRAADKVVVSSLSDTLAQQGDTLDQVQEDLSNLVTTQQSDITDVNDAIGNLQSCLEKGGVVVDGGNCVPLARAVASAQCSSDTVGLLKYDSGDDTMLVCKQIGAADFQFEPVAAKVPERGSKENPALSCKDALQFGRTESGPAYVTAFGTQEAFQVFCDMETQGGGWMFVARGHSETDDAQGQVSLDPDDASRWHFSSDLISRMVGNKQYELYITYGANSDVRVSDNGDPVSDPADLEYYRVRRQSEPLTFEKPMFAYEGWSGDAWVTATDIGATEDRGPAWSADGANFCCKRGTGGDWTDCELASMNKEGQFSNLNTNQHLRCTIDDYSSNGLVIFMREVEGTEPRLGYSASTPAASCLSIKQQTATVTDGVYWINANGKLRPFQVYCDMTTDGGGWTYVARGTSQSDNALGPVMTDPQQPQVWHMSTETIHDIVGEIPYESYITFGRDTPGISNDDPEHRQYRVRREHEQMRFSQPMFNYQGWTGTGWSRSGREGASTDRGPSWEADEANYCCERDAGTEHSKQHEWINCQRAPRNQEGQFSNVNTNQHLRCLKDTTVQNGLVIFVR